MTNAENVEAANIEKKEQARAEKQKAKLEEREKVKAEKAAERAAAKEVKVRSRFSRERKGGGRGQRTGGHSRLAPDKHTSDRKHLQQTTLKAPR